MDTSTGDPVIEDGAPTWVVLDIETTGLSPKEHRIVEIAVIVLDARGNPLGEATTLVDPEGDVGPSQGHGIEPDDVEDAPRFDELAGWLAQWLRGKVVVGHNLLFTTAFLDEEFRRAGIDMPHIPAICTMTHAPRYLPSLPGRTLEQCCAAAGIAVQKPVSALGNARAAGKLFGVFLSQRPVLPSPWLDFIGRSRRMVWPEIAPRDFQISPREFGDEVAQDQAPAASAGGATSPAGVGDRVFPETTSEFVIDVVDSAPRQLDESESIGAYLGALDSAVSDRVLSFTEAIHLKDLAGALAVYEAEQGHAHRIYVRTLAATAWADHRITDEERADLVQVGKLLDLSEQDVAAIIEETRPAVVRDDVPASGSAEASAFVKAAQRALAESRNGDGAARPTGTAKVRSAPRRARSTPVPVSPAGVRSTPVPVTSAPVSVTPSRSKPSPRPGAQVKAKAPAARHADEPATDSGPVESEPSESARAEPVVLQPAAAKHATATPAGSDAGRASVPTQSSFQAGWYPDPSAEARLRWYDGDAWTDHTHS